MVLVVSARHAFWTSFSLCGIHLAASFLMWRLPRRILWTVLSKSTSFQNVSCMRICGSVITVFVTAGMFTSSEAVLGVTKRGGRFLALVLGTKQTMPSSDGRMWRGFGPFNFHQIFVNVQCAVSKFCLRRTVEAFTLLNKMLHFQSELEWLLYMRSH